MMFELPKNKMEEEKGGGWKGRTVFSHFRHPLKGFAPWVGWALTHLIHLSQSCMDTLEMDKIDGVKDWVDKTHKELHRQGREPGYPDAFFPSMFFFCPKPRCI